jgi:light-regulated signal transduction histidine kinase (bacteriophytochrome)
VVASARSVEARDAVRREREREVERLNAVLEHRAVELSAVNRELEAFCYSVSHDLRSPLRSIDGFGQALVEDCAAALPTTGHDHVRRIRASTQRMGQLIDDLLQLSRVTRTELRRERVDLSALACEIAAEHARAAPERRVTFAIAEGLAAEGDPSLLRVALENLLGNAWKFTSGHAEARIVVGRTERGGRPAFFVRDDGAGFDMAYAGKLFGAFQRLHGMSEFAGTGIGLATVQRIVRRHGGEIWAEGAVEKGATFTFTLPAPGQPEGEAS